MSLLDLINSIHVDPGPAASKSLRTKRTNPEPHHLTASDYVVDQLARIAVDTGIVRVVDGRLQIRNREEVSPVVLGNIDSVIGDVVRVVGEMERAREYGRCHADAAGRMENAA